MRGQIAAREYSQKPANPFCILATCLIGSQGVNAEGSFERGYRGRKPTWCKRLLTMTGDPLGTPNRLRHPLSFKSQLRRQIGHGNHPRFPKHSRVCHLPLCAFAWAYSALRLS